VLQRESGSGEAVLNYIVTDGENSDPAETRRVLREAQDANCNIYFMFIGIGSVDFKFLKAIADEFGGEIPLGPFALIGNDDIGKGIVETLTGHRSPAVLMKNHGVFTIGKDAKAAVKAAVMCEDVAKTLWIAQSMGTIIKIDQKSIDALYSRYQNVYGQKGEK
jgi:hypothetical protein